jgi:hypothetical protein
LKAFVGHPAKVKIGNVTQAGLVGNVTDSKASRQPLRPDEVLFKQANAPIRYEETDYYFANERLPLGQQLPTGELLTALHAYVSKLYSRTEIPEMERVWKCMDETALIAFGILVEETVREVLGETGDLAFTEAADEEEEQALASEDGEDGIGESDQESARFGAKQISGSISSSDDESNYSTDDTD